MKINKDAIAYLTNVSIKVIISLLSIRLLTTLLSKDEVGSYYLILSIIGFINLVILNPIGMYYNRTILEYKNKGKLFESAFFVFLSFVFVGFISIPFLFFVYNSLELNKYLSLEVFIIYIFLAIIVSTSIRNILAAFNSLGKRNLFSYVNIFSSISGLFFSIFFIYIFKKTSISWLYGIISSELIFLVIIYLIYLNVKTTAHVHDYLTRDSAPFPNLAKPYTRSSSSCPIPNDVIVTAALSASSSWSSVCAGSDWELCQKSYDANGFSPTGWSSTQTEMLYTPATLPEKRSSHAPFPSSRVSQLTLPGPVPTPWNGARPSLLGTRLPNRSARVTTSASAWR